MKVGRTGGGGPSGPGPDGGGAEGGPWGGVGSAWWNGPWPVAPPGIGRPAPAGKPQGDGGGGVGAAQGAFGVAYGDAIPGWGWGGPAWAGFALGAQPAGVGGE